MNATPMEMIPGDVLESIGSATTWSPAAGRYVPTCGCHRTADLAGFYLCLYHDGMVTGFHLAQEAAPTKDDR